MPAQWPNFINKVSAKLSSLSSSSIDEFAVFLAGEYFNSVKTSQTMYGNIHQSGQKPILEEGFKKAFKKIYEEETVEFESKFTNSKYADMFEKAPEPDTNFDAYCDLEKWTDKNKDKLERFMFYPFFNSTCPIDEKPQVTGEIDSNLLEDSLKAGEPERYITMTISGFTEGINYKFLYSINGEDQPLQIATDYVLNVLAPTQNGSYTYVFKGVYNADGVTLLKEINKTITLNIKTEGTEVIDEIKDPFVNKKQRSPIPKMTEDELIQYTALRVVYQNDGTKEFRKWIDRFDIGYNSKFGKKVKDKVLDIVKPFIEKRDSGRKVNKLTGKVIKDITIPKIESIKNNISPYIFQEEHSDRKEVIPELINPKDYICKFVYIKQIDGLEKNSKLLSSGNENDRISRKEKEYYALEKNKWYELLRKWGNSQTGSLEEDSQEGDGYDIMAQSIIDYWKSTTVQPFKPTPPILPCTSVPPLGGKYVPISYGNKNALANDLRKAWNTGKIFKRQPLTPIASKAVASAVAVSCAKHLLGVKFLYLGGLIIPVGPPIPMVGISPTTF